MPSECISCGARLVCPRCGQTEASDKGISDAAYVAGRQVGEYQLSALRAGLVELAGEISAHRKWLLTEQRELSAQELERVLDRLAALGIEPTGERHG